jgi:putative transposase
MNPQVRANTPVFDQYRHRRMVSKKWAQPQPSGRPPLSDDLVELIVRLANENRTWVVVRIQGELRRLWHRTGAETIPKILSSRRIPPPALRDERWHTFLRTHAQSILAIAFWPVPRSTPAPSSPLSATLGAPA